MKRCLCVTALLLVVLVLSGQLMSIESVATNSLSNAPTGYTCAEDVEYVIYTGKIQVTTSTAYSVENVVANWGVRGEDCLFLTTYALNYYTDSYDWQALMELTGGSGTSDAYQSQLYLTLQNIMQSTHHSKPDYQLTRAYYSFTDCIRSDYTQVSSFYSGAMTDGMWISGKYNREHIWPKSKCINTNKANDSADIMLLRPTLYTENSTRGNLAYGEGSGYFDPGLSVRGDCARMILYGYVRWGNTGKMWGTGGVMENLEILLKWMAEDPVDTWEMGRNDSVQSITGVRNVFVDFPELAWLLFGAEVPEDMITPSASAQTPCEHKNTILENAEDVTCIDPGYTGDIVCTDCGAVISAGESIPATQHSFSDWITVPGGGKESRWCSRCGYEEYRELPDCTHEHTATSDPIPPTCTQDGRTSTTLCMDCGRFTDTGETVPATGHMHTELRGQLDATCTANGHTGDTYCIDCGEKVANGTTIAATGHQNILQETGKSPTCAESGYTGDKRCTNCGEVVEIGSVIPATGEHDFDDWVSTEDGAVRSCKICSHAEWKETKESSPIWPITAIGAAVILVACILIVQIRKNKP